MKQRYHNWLCLAVLLMGSALGFTACSDNELSTPSAPTDGVSVTFCLDSRDMQDSRSTLTSSEAKSNVKHLAILVYEGAYDGTNDPRCVAIEHFTWNPVAEPEGGTTLHRMTVKLNTHFQQDTSYTLLGVAMDNESKASYTLPATSTSFKNAFATLKDTGNMGQSEFFTGFQSFAYAGAENTVIPDLYLRRRVAGVLLYVTNIPQQFEVNDGVNIVPHRVTSLKLMLGSEQHNSVWLPREFSKDWNDQYGSTLTDSRCLMEMDFSTTLYTPNSDIYLFQDTDETGNVAVKENSRLQGIYMLPLAASENATFTLQLWGKEMQNDDSGTITGTNEIMYKEFVIQNYSEEATSRTKFDIRSNYIYSIGKKPFANDTEEDKPISLTGETIYLSVEEWQDFSSEVIFDGVHIQAGFGDPLPTQIYPPAPEFVYYDESESLPPQFIEITIAPGILKSPWTLYIPDTYTALDDNGDGQTYSTNETAGGCCWLYIWDEQQKKYVKNYTATQYEYENPTKIKLLMTNYAHPRDWNATHATHINNDIRTMTLKLETKIKDGDTRYDSLSIRQYNTISVKVDNQLRGFNRVDYKKVNKIKDAEGNEKFEDVTKFSWGYHSTAASSIYDSDAHIDTKGYGDHNNGDWAAREINRDLTSGTGNNKVYIFIGSVIWHCEHCHLYGINEEGQIKDYRAEAKTNEDYDNVWYLPAMNELKALFELHEKGVHTNLKGEYYWTTFVHFNPPKHATVYRSSSKREDVDREEYWLIRQARRFDTDLKGDQLVHTHSMNPETPVP